MEDISQTVVHLSKHMISTLSNSFRVDATTCSSSGLDTGILEGLHNPTLFFQNLCGGQRSRETSHHESNPRLLAKIRLPFAGLNVSRHERMTVKSRRVVDVEDLEKPGVQETNSNFRVTEERNPEAPSTERATSKHKTLEEVRVDIAEKLEISSAVSKEDLGRATWTFLHTLAAQFPDQPTRQQQRDVTELMSILTRIYPCKECADHFKDVVRANPVDTKSRDALAQWMCRVHNVVNRSLDKPQFPCNRVDFMWGSVDCDEGACNLHGRFHNKSREEKK